MHGDPIILSTIRNIDSNFEKAVSVEHQLPESKKPCTNSTKKAFNQISKIVTLNTYLPYYS